MLKNLPEINRITRGKVIDAENCVFFVYQKINTLAEPYPFIFGGSK